MRQTPPPHGRLKSRARSGGAPLSPEIAGMLIRAFQKNGAKQPQIPLPTLSPLQRQILELLATGLAPKEVQPNSTSATKRCATI